MSDSNDEQLEGVEGLEGVGDRGNRDNEENEIQSEEEFNYQDIFEEARREDVLRDIDQYQSDGQEEKNQDVEEVLNKRAKREDKQKQKESKANERIKKLRQQNALEFFRKVKIQILLNFRDSLVTAKQAEKYSQQKIYGLLSCCDVQTLNFFMQIKSKIIANSIENFTKLLQLVFKDSSDDMQGPKKCSAVWALALLLQIQLRKISFIDISHMDLQSFYNLRYIQPKNKGKKVRKQIDAWRNKLRRRQTEQQLKDQNYVSLDSYAFDHASMKSSKSRTSNQTNVSSNRLSVNSVASNQQSVPSFIPKTQKAKKINSNFNWCFCEIYQKNQNNQDVWKLFNIQTFEIESIQQLKNLGLQGRAIIGFYSTRILIFQSEYQQLKKYRPFDNLQLRDHTAEYGDKMENVLKRRSRLGCKSIYKDVIKSSHFYKCLQIFQPINRTIIQNQRRKQMQYALKNFPKSQKQMKLNQFFIVPSMVQKYMILKQDAEPLPNLQFHQQRVYLKSDLQKVSSTLGWVDYNRMVKLNQIPIKTTQNRNKTCTKLYKFSQTQPFSIRFSQDNELVLDEQYNSIYVPPQFIIPEGYVLVPHNIQYLCKKHKFKHARIVQGFDLTSAHIVPNNIGCIVQEKNQKEIQKLYEEKQQKLLMKKQTRKIQDAMTLWRKLFKSIIITQQVYN